MNYSPVKIKLQNKEPYIFLTKNFPGSNKTQNVAVKFIDKKNTTGIWTLILNPMVTLELLSRLA